MAQLEELIQTVTDTSGSSFGRRMAVSDLGRSDDDRAFHALAALLTDDDQYLRREVVSALARKDDYRTIEPLIEALGDSDDYIQRDAAAALGKLGDVRAVEPLKMLTEDDSYSVRDAAKRALEAIEREPRTLAPPPPQPELEIETESSVVEEAAATTVGEEPEAVPAEVETAPDEPQDESLEIEPVDEEAVPEVIEEASEDIHVDDAGSILVAEAVKPPAPLDIEPASSPWEQVAEIVTAAPLDIVTAEIVVEPTSQPAAEIGLPSGALLLGIPQGFSWDTARRMRAFFGDQLPDIQQAYELLREQQEKLITEEREHHEIVQQLSFRRADKDDDLGQCEDDIDTAREELQRLERSAARVRRDFNQARAEAESLSHQLVTSIWPEKAKKSQQMRSEIEGTLRKLQGKISATRDRISELEEEHSELAEPRKTLQAAAESTAADKDVAGELVRAANEAINEGIISTIRRLPREELEARLKQLGVLSADRTYFQACVSEMMAAVGEFDGTVAKLEKSDTEVEQAEDAAGQVIDSLGAAIAAGFHIAAVEKQTPVRLHGSLRFQEEHSFFGGYSGVSGSASGSGSGQATYSVDEVEWRSPADFQQQVAGFAEAWASYGEQTGRREMLSALSTAGRRIVAEYVHFIRTELERDFVELHTER